jgi:hypothetical protein
MIEFLAVLLVVAPIANLYFVWHGWHVYRSDPERSPILRALFVLKVAVWMIAVACAIFATRFLVGLPPFPFNGLTVAFILVAINLMPAYIHLVVRQYERR